MVSSLTYIFLSFSSSSSYQLLKFFYKLAYLGVLESFGIIIYRSYKNKLSTLSVSLFLVDDNLQYTYDALIWFLMPVTYGISLLPFILFSIFHCLVYLKNVILPIFAEHNGSKQNNYFSNLILQIANFITSNNESSLIYSANLELIVFAFILFKAVIFSKYSWYLVILYSVFVKLRFDKSPYTRSAVKAHEVRIDGLISDPRMPPSIKQGWANFKNMIYTANPSKKF